MEVMMERVLTHAADQAGLSRRHFLRTVGLAAGGAGLLVAGPASAQAPVDVVNFALALEHLEAVFYEQAVVYLALQASGLPRGIPGLINLAKIINITQIVRGHEETHEQALAAVVRSLGGTPVPRCHYNFSSAFTSVTAYLQTARALEETGVTAYLGAVPLLVGLPAVLQGAAQIVTMEARHASLFRDLLGESDPLSGQGTLAGFSGGAFDRPASIPEVKAKAQPFIADAVCPPLKP